jgi:hypothetical protein
MRRVCAVGRIRVTANERGEVSEVDAGAEECHETDASINGAGARERSCRAPQCAVPDMTEISATIEYSNDPTETRR